MTVCQPPPHRVRWQIKHFPATFLARFLRIPRVSVATAIHRLLAALALAGACGEPTPEPDAADVAAPAGSAPALAPADVDGGGGESSAEPDAGTRDVDPIAALPPTELGLTLLATMSAADPADAAATIRNDETGVIRQYRVGDPLAEDATLAAVSRGVVQVQRPSLSESLSIRVETVELRDGDVYYPDLVEPDDFVGVLAQGLQLPAGLHYIVKRPDNAWGTPHTVRRIQDAVRRYHERAGAGGPKIHVGDISRKGGGAFPPHLSHRHGRDVDVGYVLTGPEADETLFRNAGRHNLDVARTWALLDGFLATDAVHYIFMDHGLQKILYEHAVAEGVPAERLDRVFQYPRGRHAPNGLVRHWRGHVNHFHVRFHE